jgi:ATP-dependent helicase HrpA
MSLKILDKLHSMLDTCMLRDKFPLLQSLRQLQRKCRDGQGDDPNVQHNVQQQIGALTQRIEKSVALYRFRQQAVPRIDYPESLPVAMRVDDIKQALLQHQVVIIAGETGSGKTTQLPKICLDIGRGIAGMIGHTQPRRLAARTVATRIAEELGVKEGEEVGFQVRFADNSSERTLIKLMTDGILLAETQNDPWLNRYDTIIIDEAHERSLNIDFLLGYLHRLLPKRPDLKLLITSATIDVEKFSAHFNHAPIVEVSGRTYAVEIRYRPQVEQEGDAELPEQVLAAFEEIQQLERKHRPSHRDVLVFLSGEKEIREVAEVFRKQKLPNLEILPLYARLSNNEQQRVFQSHAGRRIVLTTNVAETSLTVPGIGYVIDSGLARISRYSVRSKIQRLPIEAISQASANQRAGRCGRLGPGVCIRLYSETDFVSRPLFTDTEITRTNLASVILQMLALKLGDIEKFPFIEVPEARAVRDGFKLLEELQAVSEAGNLLTCGKEMAAFPVDPRLARVLLEAAARNCLTEILIIVSALSIQDPRERPLDKQQAADEAHRRFWLPESDFWAFINLWQFHEEQRQELGSNAMRKFCQKNFLSWMRMREWREVHRQLLLMCHELKLKLNPQPSSYEQVHMALLSGFLSQVANRLEDGTYLGARSRRYVLFPGSALHKKNYKWLVSAELVETTQLYARMNAKVEPEWIEALAAHLIRKEYSEPHWEQKRGQVLAFERVLLYGLALVEKRRVAYAPIDALVSREIFIREALVGMQIKTRAPFYHANIQLIARISNLEERTRRRDILVDESHIYAFYDQLLPATVVDVASLERWYFALPKAQAKELFLTEAYLMNAEVSAQDLQQFPQHIQTSDMALQLQYAFDPGKDQDGVSVEVPVSVLKQLKADELDWLVPGLLREKCIALIKGLPKQLRKNFVPVPDVVDKVLPLLEQKDGSLQQALARQLLRKTGVQIPLDSWNPVELPEHLRMNIRVLDDEGKMLGAGRDLLALREMFSGTVQASISKAASGTLEKQGLTQWDFGALPLVHELGSGKVTIKAYPALVDKGDSVDLCLLDNEYKARLATRNGVVRLLMFASKQQVRYLQKELLQDPARLIQLSSLGKRDDLLDQLIKRAYAIAFKLDDNLPRDQQAFAELLDKYRTEVIDVATRLQDLVYKIVTLRHEILKLLQQKFSGVQELALMQDVGQQLEHLVHRNFLPTSPWLQMQQFPRYLQAILGRLEKYPMQPTKDQEHTTLMSRLWRQYIERRQYHDKHEIEHEGLDEYRWLLEELRVSLFAQALGTRVPVSEKRLQKYWLDLVG